MGATVCSSSLAARSYGPRRCASLLADATELRAMGRRARTTAETGFGVKRHVDATMEVYAAVTASAGG